MGRVLKENRASCELIPEFSLMVIKREANMVAHRLAQQAMHGREFVVKRLDCPDSVRSLVEREAVTPHVSKPHDYVNHMFTRL
jgi:hypothetical protein